METNTDRPTETCCPTFDPAKWQGKELVWDHKPFVREHVRCILHVPLNFGGAVGRAMKHIDAAAAASPDRLILTSDPSPWRSELYVETTKEVPGAEMEALSGRFLVRVYEGPYREAGRWCADAVQRAKEAGHAVGKVFLAYPTCPACAKKYGHNWVMVFAQVGAAA